MTKPLTALITGACSGIGRAFATLLDDRGCQLHLLDVADRPGSELESAAFTKGDVGDPLVWEDVAAQTGGVDLLCLNAGVVSSTTGPPWQASPEEWDRVLGVNLHGIVNGLRTYVPLMLDRGTPASIIVTASLAGAATWPGGGPYAASKHAALAVAEQAALHLVDTNVSVTAVCPALVRTGMSETGDDPLDVADAALAAAADGQFAVLPEPWHQAIQDRAAMLVSGAVPTMPEPTATP